MSIRKFVFLFSFIIFLSFAPKVFAETHVSGNIDTNTTWSLANSPYVVDNTVIILAGNTLTVEPGVIMKFSSSFGSLEVEGTLDVPGTAKLPIVFTSYKDDNAGGDTNADGTASFPESLDWRGIIFHPNSVGNISHASILFGGQYIFMSSGFVSFPMIRQNGGTLALDNVELSPYTSLVDGLGQTDGNTTIANSQIKNAGNSISISGGALSIHGSVIDGINYALKNDSANMVDAKNNWWSDPSGPTHINNPNGVGGRISGDVSFSPWLNVDPTIALITLSASPDVGFSGDATNASIEPNFGNTGTVFTFKTVYTNSFNQSPTSVRLVITRGDSNAPCQAIGGGGPPQPAFFFKQIFAITAYASEDDGCVMSLDMNSSAILHDGDYANGEQYVIKQKFPVGNYKYRIEADNTRYPETGSFAFQVNEDCCSSILFLPGIEASRLYKQKTALGLLVEDQLWEPNVNSDVEDLYLNIDGTSKNSNIYTRDIIKESNVPIPMGPLGQNIYKSFSNAMDGLVDDEKIGEWKPFAYDWRQSVDDIVNNGTKYQSGNVSLVATLQSLVNSTKNKNGKVTIVAHSNGGLLAKALLKKLQDDKVAGRNNLIDSVDVLILVATPEIGTASAVPVVLHGYDQEIAGGWLMDEVRAREVGRNMLGAFGLLPSREYINRVSASPVTFVDNLIPSNVTTKLVKTFGSAIDSYAEYKSFLFGGEGRINPTISQTNLPISLSQSLFAKTESLHDSIDSFVPPASLRVIEVAGWGLDTIASFEYYPRLDCGSNLCASYILDERPRFTSDGDKTVVVPSAQYMSVNGNAEKYWVDLPVHNRQLPLGLRRNRNHGDILEVTSLNNLIQSVVEKKDIIFDDVLKNSEPADNSNRLRLSIHSPVTLDAYDANGNHTGKICPLTSDFCYKEENIVNSSYVEFGEGKYLNLPEDQMKSIKLQGTDVGTFTYSSEKVLPNGTSITSFFVDIPVTTQTQAQIILNPSTQTPQLALDVTGDGTTDFIVTPNSAFDPVLFLQVMRKTVDSFDISKQQKNALEKRIDDTIKAIQKGKINKAKIKIEQFKKILIIYPKESDRDRRERERRNEREHERERREHRKPGQLSSADAQTLITLLNQLLDNLN
ncbi:MAG: hypothetical protein NTZ87_04295 [Candidatus Nomurabacteria bacterium]|nr:hypothetical protein [Candidatus Nomurabacteria bacterium]